MQMPSNPTPAAGATQAALTQAQAPQTQANAKPAEPNDGGKFGKDLGGEIMKNLEQHLNQLPDQQKMFLAGSLQHYANIVIPVLGIVCGQEVMQYFVNIYKQNFAQQGQQNPQGPQQPGQPQQPQLPQSVPHPATGQQPNSAPLPQQAQPNAGAAPRAQAPAQQPL